MPVQESFEWEQRNEPSRNDYATGRTNAFRLIGEDDGPVASLSQSLLVHGHAVDALDLVPEESVQTAVTSPSHWSLRDYEVDRQIGRDASLEEYVSGIVDTFTKVRRVLAANGTVC